MTELEGEELDFEIIREDWSRYKLEDGTLLKIKNPLLKVFKMPKADQLGLPIYRTIGSTLIGAIVPKTLKGAPSADEKIEPSDIVGEVKFTTIIEEWCEYKLADSNILRAKTIVTKVFKTKKFNGFGEPIYWSNWQVLLDKTISSKK